jgi:hypothetical protein
MTEWDWAENDPEWLDEEPARCELDHPDGGACLRRLSRDGTCPEHPELAS